MNAKKRIALISAALMSISPVVSLTNNALTAPVYAASYQSRTLTFKHNSYIYNSKGKRLSTFKGKRAYYKAKQTLKANLVTTDDSDYYTYQKGKKIYLKVYTIKGKKYLNVGGGYININNIGYIDNMPFYVDQDVRIQVTKTTHTVDQNGNTNDQVIKKGTTLTADGLGEIPGGGWIDSGVPVEYYRIKGTNNFIESDYAKLLSPVQTDKDFTDLFPNKVQVNGKQTSLYTVNGKNAFPNETTFSYSSFNVDSAMYIYLPDEKKTELLYHITDASFNLYNTETKKDSNGMTNPGNLFIKASALDLTSGSAPKAINTKESTTTTPSVANVSQKQELNDEINKSSEVEKSAKFILASASRRTGYQTALDYAKKINSSASATTNEVLLATASLKSTESKLDGQKITVAYPNFLSNNERTKILNLVNAQYRNEKNTTVKFANHDRELVKMTFDDHGEIVKNIKKLDINDYIQADTPKIKNKKGYDSSATESSLEKDKTLAKYANWLDYNMRKSALVAKKTTPIYQSTTKVGASSSFNVNKINLRKTKSSIKKGNNIGYYATLVAKIKGQYYFMIQEKTTYFVKAKDVKLDNFSHSSTYKKYQGQIDKLMGSTQLEDFAVRTIAKKNTPFYNTNNWFEISKSKKYSLKKGQHAEFVDPYIVKYNGQYFVTGGKEFNSDYDPEGAVLAKDVTINKIK